MLTLLRSDSQRAAAFGFSAAFVSSAGQTFFIGLFGRTIQADLGIDESQWGGLYAFATLCSGMLMFWLGALADRLPMKNAIAGALAILGVGAALMAAAPGPALLLAALFCLRLGGQGLTGHMAIVTAARSAHRPGRNLATASLGFIAGEALLPLAVLALLGWLDWRWVWACIALLVLGAALPALRLAALALPAAPAASAHADAPPRLRRRHLAYRPAFPAALSVLLFSPLVVTAVFLHQSTLADLNGWSAASIALGFLGFAAAQAVSTWLAGWCADRYGVTWLFRLYLLPAALGLLALGFGPSNVALWGMFLGLGATAGAGGVMSGALWVRVFGIENLGLVRGVYTGFMVLATAVSPFLFGVALAADASLALLASGVAAYAAVVPWLAATRLGQTFVPG